MLIYVSIQLTVNVDQLIVQMHARHVAQSSSMLSFRTIYTTVNYSRFSTVRLIYRVAQICRQNVTCLKRFTGYGHYAGEMEDIIIGRLAVLY